MVAPAVWAGVSLFVVLRAGVVEVLPAIFFPCGAGSHASSADAAAEDAAGELPKPVAAVRVGFVLEDDLPRRVDEVSRHAGVGDGHGYPLLPGFRDSLDASAVDALSALVA